jgi:hypothetical protein
VPRHQIESLQDEVEHLHERLDHAHGDIQMLTETNGLLWKMLAFQMLVIAGLMLYNFVG